MSRILLIRHGKTAGNLTGKYIGRTDEPLCPEGIRELQAMESLEAGLIFCSPMRRCRQTAAILFPAQKPIVFEALRECDFGSFEGKNYRELDGNADYQRWIDSGGTLPFPCGESPEHFKRRCTDAFELLVTEYRFDTAALVIHGGTIMAIMEKFALPKRGFYEYHVKNGHGFLTEWDGSHLTILHQL